MNEFKTTGNLSMNNIWKTVLSGICFHIDLLIFQRINVPWEHHYRREKVQLYPNEELCKAIRDSEGNIRHDVAYPAYYDWVLYDGDVICIKMGCRGFEHDKELMESTDCDFLKAVDDYYEIYKYFSLTLWLERKLYPLKLDPEAIL